MATIRQTGVYYVLLNNGKYMVFTSKHSAPVIVDSVDQAEKLISGEK